MGGVECEGVVVWNVRVLREREVRWDVEGGS